MRSHKSSFLKEKPAPAPLKHQQYASRVHTLGEDQFLEKDQLERPEIKWVPILNPPERFYTKETYDDWLTTVADQDQFEAVIPVEDPYWLERELDAYIGGDLRYLYGSRSGDQVPERLKDYNFLMAFDLGTRFRPTLLHQLSFVVESRFLNGPQNDQIEEGFTSDARVKSAYVLVDNLGWNSFVQAGLYRPMFGSMNPDHTALAQELSGFNQYSVFKSVGFGSAPNVPFFTFNYIMPMADRTYTPTTAKYLGSRDEGYTLSVGGRFVSYGASVLLSYWNTRFRDPALNAHLERKMYSLALGGAYQNFIANIEYLWLDKEFAVNAHDKGYVLTNELKYRFWREYYAVLNYAQANTDRNLKSGKAKEYALGLKSFLVSGVELEALYLHRDQTTGNQSVKEDGYQLQLHLFW